MPRKPKLGGFKQWRERRPERMVTQQEFDLIVTDVCNYYKVVDPKQMYQVFRGNVSGRPSFRARQTVIYLILVCYDASFADAVTFFPELNTTTCRNAELMIERLREDSKEIDRAVTQFENTIINRRISNGRSAVQTS